MTQGQDIYDTADNAVETKPEYAYWGQVAMELFEAVWPKGAQACERFDPTIHNANDRFIRGEIVIICIDEMQARFNAEWKGNVTGWNNRDWAAIILPSIKALGISARELPGKFVKVVKKPNGKFYEKKKDGVKTGEKAELTDFLFVKLFASMDACTADYLETKAGDPVSPTSDAAFPVADAPLNNVPVQTQAPDALLLKFAQAIVTSAAKNAPGDVAKITELVRAQVDVNPLLKGKFTTDSIEIQEMILAVVTQ